MYTNEEDRKTALHFAAQKDDKVVMRKMIERGLFLDAEDKNGWTPLHEAAYYGSKGAAGVLIEKGQSHCSCTSHVFALPAVIASPSHSHEGGIATNICIALIGLISLAY